MKTLAAIILAIVLLNLVSCKTPQQTAQLVAIGNRILAYAEIEGKITPEEAALVRDVGKIAVTTDPVVVIGAAEPVSGK